MPWRLLAGPWGRPSSGISTWRLRRRTSSRRAVCVFQGFREEQLEEKKTIFFKVWSPSPSPLRGWNCDPSRKRILHVPQALDPETQKKTPPFLRRVRRRRPPAGCSSNLWSSWVFKKKKAGKGNVEVNEVEVSQMSRSRRRGAESRPSAERRSGRAAVAPRHQGERVRQAEGWRLAQPLAQSHRC